jgi:hypothetical protein
MAFNTKKELKIILFFPTKQEYCRAKQEYCSKIG